MNQLKTILLLGALSALVVAAGAALGPQWLWGALALALGMNLFAWFFSDRLVLRMYGRAGGVAREAPGAARDGGGAVRRRPASPSRASSSSTPRTPTPSRPGATPRRRPWR